LEEVGERLSEYGQEERPERAVLALANSELLTIVRMRSLLLFSPKHLQQWSKALTGM
jgi:hypothetical protein